MGGGKQHQGEHLKFLIGNFKGGGEIDTGGEGVNAPPPKYTPDMLVWW